MKKKKKKTNSTKFHKMITFTSLENRSVDQFGFVLNPLEKSPSFNNTVYIKKGFVIYPSQDLIFLFKLYY